MKKIITGILISFVVLVNTHADFMYQEIDPICSISGTTHTSFPGEISDTSSWSIPKAYDGECETTVNLTSKQKRKLYSIVINHLENKNFLINNNTGYRLNEKGQDYIQNNFFPLVQKFIKNEIEKQNPNTTHIAILNHSVSMIGYDYFIASLNLSGEYIGLSISQAQDLAVDNNVNFRVIEQDGKFFPVTMDYRPGRINATIENGIVVSYHVK